MEEDEEELYSEMQLEDGGRRRPSGTSHNALKVSTELMTGGPRIGGCSILSFHPDYSTGAVRSYQLLLSTLPRGLGTRVWGIHLGSPRHSHCSGNRVISRSSPKPYMVRQQWQLAG